MAVVPCIENGSEVMLELKDVVAGRLARRWGTCKGKAIVNSFVT